METVGSKTASCDWRAFSNSLSSSGETASPALETRDWRSALSTGNDWDWGDGEGEREGGREEVRPPMAHGILQREN